MGIERAVGGTRHLIHKITCRNQTVERVNFNPRDFVRSVIRARFSKSPPKDLKEYLKRYDEDYRD